jgi:hypothetical protein
MPSPSERAPDEVEDRAVPGHWEGDLLSGSNHTHIATLVERSGCPPSYGDRQRGSRAGDGRAQGVLDRHRRPLLLSRPRSPWQRGTNQNTNRLHRQYFPKGTDLSVRSQADLNRTARQLNQRPRKTLAFHSQGDVVNENEPSVGPRFEAIVCEGRHEFRSLSPGGGAHPPRCQSRSAIPAPAALRRSPQPAPSASGLRTPAQPTH